MLTYFQNFFTYESAVNFQLSDH